MTKLPKLDYRALGAELFIVFVGLLLALQVDEWRQDRELDEAEVRYLQRLKVDLDSFVEFAEGFLETRKSISSAVQHVSDSFTAGQIIGDDRRKFEAGIIYVGHLPDLRLQRSAYDGGVGNVCPASFGGIKERNCNPLRPRRANKEKLFLVEEFGCSAFRRTHALRWSIFAG